MMNKYEERELRNLASALYDVRYSLSCDYCTKEKCRTDKSGGVSRKSCLDCIMDYWREILKEKAGKRKIEEVNMMIRDYIGTPALLEQFAEECNELAQASLKYARKLRGENPTPKKIDEIRDNFWEEIADILVCLDELQKSKLIDYEYVMRTKKKKRKRWYERIEEREYERKNRK